MALATREAILSANDLEFADVDVPLWGTVRVRMLSACERLDLTDEFGDSVSGKEALRMLCRVIVLTAIDEQGQAIFTAEDMDKLAAKNWDKVKQVADASMRLNGLGGDVVEEAEKNSETTPSAG